MVASRSGTARIRSANIDFPSLKRLSTMTRAPAATRHTGPVPLSQPREFAQRRRRRIIAPQHQPEDPMIDRRVRHLGALAAIVLFGVAVSLAPVLAAGDPEPRTQPAPKAGTTKGG